MIRSKNCSPFEAPNPAITSNILIKCVSDFTNAKTNELIVWKGKSKVKTTFLKLRHVKQKHSYGLFAVQFRSVPQKASFKGVTTLINNKTTIIIPVLLDGG